MTSFEWAIFVMLGGFGLCVVLLGLMYMNMISSQLKSVQDDYDTLYDAVKAHRAAFVSYNKTIENLWKILKPLSDREMNTGPLADAVSAEIAKQMAGTEKWR